MVYIQEAGDSFQTWQMLQHSKWLNMVEVCIYIPSIVLDSFIVIEVFTILVSYTHVDLMYVYLWLGDVILSLPQ